MSEMTGRWVPLALPVVAAITWLAAAFTGPGALATPDTGDLRSARQVIVVTAQDRTSTTGEVHWFDRAPDGSWSRRGGPVRARLGWAGMIEGPQRMQDSGKTPMGVYPITNGFGRRPVPGSQLPYRIIDRDDAWTFDARVPATYNMFQDAPRTWRRYGDDVEILWSHGDQYRYVAVIDFNIPPGPISVGNDGVRRTAVPADTAQGGGIFLHVDDGGATAGCVAIPEAAMRRVLTWLDPAADPMIVIGTPGSVGAALRSA